MNNLRARFLFFLTLLPAFTALPAVAQPLRFAWLSGDQPYCTERMASDPGIAFTLVTDKVSNFDFEAGGIRFLGCGLSNAPRAESRQISSESLRWLDSTVRMVPPQQRVVFVSPCPLDTLLVNYFKVLNILKRCNVQLLFAGRHPQRGEITCCDLPCVVPAPVEADGMIRYNIVEADMDSLRISEYTVKTFGRSRALFPPETWFAMPFDDTRRFAPDPGSDGRRYLPADYPWPNYSVNDSFPKVRVLWERDLQSDIAAVTAVDGRTATVRATDGLVYTVSLRDGSLLQRSKADPEDTDPAFPQVAVRDRFIFVPAEYGMVSCITPDGTLSWQHKVSTGPISALVSIKRHHLLVCTADGIVTMLKY